MSKSKFPRSAALEVARRFEDHFSSCPAVSQFAVAGSVRRLVAQVGDLDLIVVAERPGEALCHFLAFPSNDQTICAGKSKASVTLNNGLQVDVRFVPQGQFGAMLAHCTGPREHNISIRSLARQLGLKVNEYGVYRGQECLAGADESSVYAALGLDWIEPPERGILPTELYAQRNDSQETIRQVA